MEEATTDGVDDETVDQIIAKMANVEKKSDKNMGDALANKTKTTIQKEKDEAAMIIGKWDAPVISKAIAT